MTEAKYKVSLENVKKYFKLLELDVNYGLCYDKTSISKYSKNTVLNLCANSDFTYDELFKQIMINSDYDIFIPQDYGVFQFYIEKSKNKISKIVYCYYSNSRNFSEIGKLIESSDSLNENIIRDYQHLFDDVPERNNIVYFRYDFDPSIYNGIIHASSHLHIGWDNEIRIPIRNIVTPEMFVDFVVKNVYKELWRKALGNSKFKSMVLKLKSESALMERCFFCEEEKKILYLG